MGQEDHPSVRQSWRDPFTRRLEEAAALQRDPASSARAAELAEELVVAEANEVAGGWRHVSIGHGPLTAHRAEQVDTFLGNVSRMVPLGRWLGRRGQQHVIITVAGGGADALAEQIAALADFANPGHWQVSLSARPGLPPAP